MYICMCIHIYIYIYIYIVKIQSLKRQSLTVRNLGFPSIELTGIAIALYLFSLRLHSKLENNVV